MKKYCWMVLWLPCTCLAVSDAAFQALQQRVTELERRLIDDTPSSEAPTTIEARVQAQKNAARARMRQDGQKYKMEDLQAIEDLYQVANQEWKSDNARRSLAKLLARYDEANRTGCAILYMGQMHEGEEREKYYTMAMQYHSDCYYGNGANVGGLARYYLIGHYRSQGLHEKAAALEEELRTNYPDALSHRGQFLVDLLKP